MNRRMFLKGASVVLASTVLPFPVVSWVRTPSVTGITSLGSGVIGQQITIFPATCCKVTTNASITLKDQCDFIMTKGDSLTLVYDDHWREIWRST